MIGRSRPAGAQGSMVTLAAVCAGPIIWFLHFVTLYGAETLACASPDGPTIMRATATAATLLALGALAAMSYVFARGQGEAEPRPFLRGVALLLSLLAAVAIVWTAMALTMVAACAAS